MPPGNFVVDPLYDVTITPLTFTLEHDCDLFGDSEILFWWHSPDDQYHELTFHSRGKKTTTVNGFEWARAEVGALANLHVPRLGFRDWDPGNKRSNFLNPGPSKVNLVPGKSRLFGTILTEDKGDFCSANIRYTITYQLRLYPSL